LAGVCVLFAKNKLLVWITNELLRVLNKVDHFILLPVVVIW
jgi:hypothetical protein